MHIDANETIQIVIIVYFVKLAQINIFFRIHILQIESFHFQSFFERVVFQIENLRELKPIIDLIVLECVK